MNTIVVSVTVGASSTLSVDNSIEVLSSQGLSSSVKTGIPVGVTCGVLAVAIFYGYFIRSDAETPVEAQKWKGA